MLLKSKIRSIWGPVILFKGVWGRVELIFKSYKRLGEGGDMVLRQISITQWLFLGYAEKFSEKCK